MWGWLKRKKKPVKNSIVLPPEGTPLFLGMIMGISQCSDSQMTECLRQKCVTLIETSPSEAECFDLLNSISKEPCVKVADKVCLGEISSFIQTYCDVTKYYARPEDAGDSRNTDRRENISF